ncbi:1,6-anhydro-N-acetylmuramyl-L-alanine amidase AmpD [Accumulibacter sp.]|uniref:1,6-anhydro-N-acetylmuramyl-L-alanine amidase AmpD n=1 Tax=Accumulibacter sp. TaxID=2053492 RepID=UPI0025CBE97C|nr:1,6-anhydro-N-acetylmuramyl-L-alanine amidase AmpD [Accumulibacter sp.]MCM8594168.1 1,6-anhydro-N-acetylmuramyl-L-alanine amidase AmpD [Accumulibacter sp.]MCM8625730.1 1,6-anhydro-N-acetylmuramyl-L-alanine amidase AmpD [Accumulibacter sp.]MDS4048311.1 1,6-anhydro-N-acetylmuramyl-L-alanine amidase AmpD [Accumulibacter sp.]
MPLVGRDGWIEGVTRVESPNHDGRPDGVPISLIVIHSISLPPGQFGGKAVLDLFTNRLDPEAHPYFVGICNLRVSAHFLIARDGSLIQLVSCLERAWHAGVSSWNGQARCNDFSLGIEVEGCDDTPFDDRQYASLSGLIDALRRSYPIRAIVGHSDVAPGRKTDPGPRFDWQRLGAFGLLPGNVRDRPAPCPIAAEPGEG